MNSKLLIVPCIAISLAGCMNPHGGTDTLPHSDAVGQQATQTPEAPNIENGLNDHNGPGTANNTPGSAAPTSTDQPMNRR